MNFKSTSRWAGCSQQGKILNSSIINSVVSEKACCNEGNPNPATAQHSCHFSEVDSRVIRSILTHMQASRRTFDMMERRETLPSAPPPRGQTIWSGYGGSGKSVDPHSYAARVTDAMWGPWGDEVVRHAAWTDSNGIIVSKWGEKFDR